MVASTLVACSIQTAWICLCIDGLLLQFRFRRRSVAPLALRSLSALVAANLYEARVAPVAYPPDGGLAAGHRPLMPPRGRPTLVVLSLVASSSVASLSSASSCDAAAACRSLALAACLFSRLSAQLRPPRGILWPLEFIDECLGDYDLCHPALSLETRLRRTPLLSLQGRDRQAELQSR